MKKIAQLLAGALVALSFASGVAAAASVDQNCSISGPTGPDSVNTCTNNESNTITINCTNELDVLYINGQAAGSGNAVVDGNTGVGNVQSGSAGNTNFNYTNANVSCGPATQASTTTTGGQGAGKVAVAPAPAPAVKSLPKTGSDAKVAVAAVATAGFAVLATAIRFGTSAFRKLS